MNIRVIRVKTPYIDGSGFLEEIWYAAIRDDTEAIRAVREKSGSSEDIEISIVSELNSSNSTGVRMEPGEVRPAP